MQSRPNGGWTFDTLKAFMESKLEEVEKRINQRFEDSNRAISKAEASNDKRFESVNEFRNTLADQARDLMPRREVDVIMLAVSTRISALENRELTRSGSTSGRSELIAYLLAAISVIVAVSTVIFHLKSIGQ